jgi:type IV pilus assembly protein PilM
MTSPAVGLDVGSHVLKALCLEEAPSALRLVSYGSAPCPEGSIVGGEVVDPPALGAALEVLFAENGVDTSGVVLALKGPGLFVRRLTVPSSDPDEAAELVGWELEQILPWPLEEVNFDYHVQPSVGGGEGQEVIVDLL